MEHPVLDFLFVVAIPFVLVVGAVVTLLAVGALFFVLDNAEETRQRIEAAFRRPLRPARHTGPHHYYKPYWRDGGSKAA